MKDIQLPTVFGREGLVATRTHPSSREVPPSLQTLHKTPCPSSPPTTTPPLSLSPSSPSPHLPHRLLFPYFLHHLLLLLLPPFISALRIALWDHHFAVHTLLLNLTVTRACLSHIRALVYRVIPCIVEAPASIAQTVW